MKNILVSIAALLIAVVSFDAQAFKKATQSRPAVQTTQTPGAPVRPTILNVAPKVDDVKKAELPVRFTEVKIANFIIDEAAKSATNEDAQEYIGNVIDFLKKNEFAMKHTEKINNLPLRPDKIDKDQQAILEGHKTDLLKRANEAKSNAEAFAIIDQYQKEHPDVDVSALKLKIQIDK